MLTIQCNTSLLQAKSRKSKDVGLGAGVCGGSALRAVDARSADSGTWSQPVHRVRQLPDQRSFRTGACHSLLCSQLYFPVSDWCARVHGLTTTTFLLSMLPFNFH